VTWSTSLGWVWKSATSRRAGAQSEQGEPRMRRSTASSVGKELPWRKQPSRSRRGRGGASRRPACPRPRAPKSPRIPAQSRTSRRPARRPSHFQGGLNTSPPLTDRAAHGDLAVSRSDSAPSIRDVRDRAGEEWPEWARLRWRRSTSPTNFFIFSPPPEIPVSCPRTQARLSHRPASLPVSPVRGDARLRFAARSGTTPLFEPSRLPPPR